MNKPNNISYEDLIKTITMFWIDRDLEDTMAKEVNDVVDSLATKLTKIDTKDGLKEYICSDKDSLGNILSLMEISEEKFKSSKPRIPWSEIEKHREGLLIGSACEVGELYLAVMDEEPDEALDKIAAKYDYVEIQPAENKLYCIDDDEESYDEGLAYVHLYDKKVVEVAERLGKMLVATSDAHFVTKDEAIVRSVLQRHVGYADDHQLDIYFRTTEEMLEEFAYLGGDKAREVVITNTVKIADMCDTISPVRPDKCPPVIEDSDKTLRDICYTKAHEMYGDPLPEIVEKRQELDDDIFTLGRELEQLDVQLKYFNLQRVKSETNYNNLKERLKEVQDQIKSIEANVDSMSKDKLKMADDLEETKLVFDETDDELTQLRESILQNDSESKSISDRLDDIRSRINEAVSNGVFVLTGGPGTGKTTIIKSICYFFR